MPCVSGISAEGGQVQAVFVKAVEEAAVMHDAGIENEGALMTVAGFLHPAHQIGILTELNIDAGRGPHHAAGTVGKEDSPGIGLGRAVDMNRAHSLAVGPGEGLTG